MYIYRCFSAPFCTSPCPWASQPIVSNSSQRSMRFTSEKYWSVSCMIFCIRFMQMWEEASQGGGTLTAKSGSQPFASDSTELISGMWTHDPFYSELLNSTQMFTFHQNSFVFGKEPF